MDQYIDLPHPVPVTATLRYKENYLNVFFNDERDIFILIHFSFDTTRKMATYTCLSNTRGHVERYVEEQAYDPESIVGSTKVGNEKMTIEFVEPQKRFKLNFNDGDRKIELELTARLPVADAKAYSDHFIDKPSVRMFTSNTLNLPLEHHFQAMNATGFIVPTSGPDAGQQLGLSGWASRDHTWGFRNERTWFSHHWGIMHFPDRAVAVFVGYGVGMPETPIVATMICENPYNTYVEKIDIEVGPESDDIDPDFVRMKMIDTKGEQMTLKINCAESSWKMNHFSQVDEEGISQPLREYWTTCMIEETGEVGFGMYERGRLVINK